MRFFGYRGHEINLIFNYQRHSYLLFTICVFEKQSSVFSHIRGYSKQCDYRPVGPVETNAINENKRFISVILRPFVFLSLVMACKETVKIKIEFEPRKQWNFPFHILWRLSELLACIIKLEITDHKGIKFLSTWVYCWPALFTVLIFEAFAYWEGAMLIHHCLSLVK